jgi:hypothetical protein
MKGYKRLANLGICFGIVLISATGGIHLGQEAFWGLLKPFLRLWFVLSFIISAWFMWKMLLRTVEKKGYVNLLWLGLPVPSLVTVDLFFRFPWFRCLLLTSLGIIGLGTLRFWYLKRRQDQITHISTLL